MEKGKWTLSDGSVYEGELVNGKPHGKGKMTWANGMVYVGDFVDGIKKGKASKTISSEKRRISTYVETPAF